MQKLLNWLAILMVAGCSAIPMNAVAPKITVADMDIKSLGLFEQRFDLGLQVSNPNDFDLKIEGLEFDLEVNGNALARGVSNEPTLIQAASSAILRVEAITQSKDILAQFKTLPFDTLKEGVPYRVKGRVKTDRTGWLPFEYKGKYGSASKPKGQQV